MYSKILFIIKEIIVASPVLKNSAIPSYILCKIYTLNPFLNI